MHKVSIASFISVAILATTLGISGAAHAWHPQGNVIKSVQDVTMSSSQTSNATDANSALTVTPGDILLYTVIVSNVAPAAANHDDMANTIMTDILPMGATLTNNSTERQITEHFGTILPGDKVTDTTDDSILTNKACYTNDGNYHIVGTAQFSINGVDQASASKPCVANVSFTTSTPPYSCQIQTLAT